jgi:hypothetical protein
MVSYPGTSKAGKEGFSTEVTLPSAPTREVRASGSTVLSPAAEAEKRRLTDAAIKKARERGHKIVEVGVGVGTALFAFAVLIIAGQANAEGHAAQQAAAGNPNPDGKAPGAQHIVLTPGQTQDFLNGGATIESILASATPTETSTPSKTPKPTEKKTVEPSETPSASPSPSPEPSPRPSEEPTDKSTEVVLTFEPPTEDIIVNSAAVDATVEASPSDEPSETPTEPPTAVPFAATPMEVAMLGPVDLRADAVFKEAFAKVPNQITVIRDGAPSRVNKNSLEWVQTSAGYMGLDKETRQPLLVYEPGVDVINDFVQITYQTQLGDSLVPQTYAITPDLTGLDSVPKFKQVLQDQAFGQGPGATYNSVAYFGPWSQEEIASGASDVTESWDMLNSFNGAPPERPLGSSSFYPDKTAHKGTDITDSMVLYACSLATGEKDLGKVAEMIKSGKCNFQIGYGRKWNPANGVEYVLTRGMTQHQVDSFKIKADYNFYPDPYVRDDGKLVIQIFQPHFDNFRLINQVRVGWSRALRAYNLENQVEMPNGLASSDPNVNQILVPYKLNAQDQAIAFILPFKLQYTDINKDYTKGASLSNVFSLQGN